MQTRRLGSYTVAAIGSGDICLATSAARGVPARDLDHAIQEAIAFGIALFDVAADGDSERLVGAAVRAHRARDRVVVATRVTILAEPAGAPRRDTLRERLPVGYVQDRVEASLRATRLEVLPLVQLPLHPAWLSSAAWPELVGSCARLVDEGKVLAWGALLDPSPVQAQPVDEEPREDPAAALIAEPWLAAISVVYHLWDRRAEAVFAAADKRELPILARQPLAGGALAGRLGAGMTLPPRDDRNELDAAALERIAIAVAKLSVLVKREPPAVRSSPAARGIAELAVRPAHLECDDVAELALRFAMLRATALPRLHRRDYLLPAIAAAAAPPLSDELVARIVES